MLRHDNGSAHTGGMLLQFPIGQTGPAILLVRGIRFSSLCGQHLLPYYGVVHIGYVRGENDLSSTECRRIVNACSGGIQDQQRMTARMALWLHHQLAPRGVGVLVKGGYTCATGHGGGRLGGPTTTVACYGSFRHNADERDEFFTLARQETAKGKESPAG